MIPSITLLLLNFAGPLPASPVGYAAPEPLISHQAVAEDPVVEYEAKRKEAGKDPVKLWDLYLWCEAFDLGKQGRSCLRAIVKVDPNHREAREKLGHLEFDGKWFTTQKKLDKYKKAYEERVAKEKGLVRYEDEWVSKEDVPYLERGMVRDDEGNWVDAEEYAKITGGWTKQDLVWVSPDEIANVEKGLWKCGDEWLSLESANGYHAEIGKWWAIPSDHFVLYTTCSREVGMKALEQMERAYKDINRLLGSSPAGRVNVGLMRDVDQYGKFAAGSDDFTLTEVRGLSSVHHAYFADTWFDWDTLDFLGAGVGYWDASTDNGNAYGIHSARHAASLSLVEAIDLSPKALESARKRKLEGWDAEDFWEEKKLPMWFRYGAASYAGRYFIDQFVARGGNPNWAREWSVQNLLSRGGLQDLGDAFRGELDVDKNEESTKLLNEWGLIVAFILDGKNPAATEGLGAVKHALKTGEGLSEAFSKLEKIVIKNEQKLREFAEI